MKTSNIPSNQNMLIESLHQEKPDILNFIKQRTHDTGEAEDIYQEAMTRMTRRLQARNLPSEPKGYLYRIVMNIINDNIRSRRITGNTEPVSDSLQSNSPPLEQQLGGERRYAAFRQHLNSLPSATRNMIILRKLHDKSIAEIALLMGVSEKAVEKKINRALRDIELKMSVYA